VLIVRDQLDAHEPPRRDQRRRGPGRAPELRQPWKVVVAVPAVVRGEDIANSQHQGAEHLGAKVEQDLAPGRAGVDGDLLPVVRAAPTGPARQLALAAHDVWRLRICDHVRSRRRGGRLAGGHRGAQQCLPGQEEAVACHQRTAVARHPVDGGFALARRTGGGHGVMRAREAFPRLSADLSNEVETAHQLALGVARERHGARAPGLNQGAREGGKGPCF